MQLPKDNEGSPGMQLQKRNATNHNMTNGARPTTHLRNMHAAACLAKDAGKGMSVLMIMLWLLLLTLSCSMPYDT